MRKSHKDQIQHHIQKTGQAKVQCRILGVATGTQNGRAEMIQADCRTGQEIDPGIQGRLIQYVFRRGKQLQKETAQKISQNTDTYAEE